VRVWRRLALDGVIEKGRVRQQLLGPVHGTVQTAREMCCDEVTYEEIDGKLGELDALVLEAAGMLRAAG
jgi:hypothetical protein